MTTLRIRPTDGAGGLAQERTRVMAPVGASLLLRSVGSGALDLVAAELERIRSTFSNRAIYAGSYGWGSAGSFHFPQGQLHRFLNLFGGFVRSINTYSHAAADVAMPYIAGIFFVCWSSRPRGRRLPDIPSLWWRLAACPSKTPRWPMAEWPGIEPEPAWRPAGRRVSNS